MTRPIPVELQSQLEKHEREWLPLDWEGIDLHEMNLTDCDLSNAVMDRANLDGAILRGANLNGATFHEASLSRAMLDRALLGKAEGKKANLVGASMREAQAALIDLEEADAREADLAIANLIQADFTEANLERANLSYANLDRALFIQANLTSTDLSHADLRNACLAQANLAQANLTGAALHGAMLSKVQGVESVQVEWIDIGVETAPERLEGDAARYWLQEAATKPLPEWWSRTRIYSAAGQAPGPLTPTQKDRALLMDGRVPCSDQIYRVRFIARLSLFVRYCSKLDAINLVATTRAGAQRWLPVRTTLVPGREAPGPCPYHRRPALYLSKKTSERVL